MNWLCVIIRNVSSFASPWFPEERATMFDLPWIPHKQRGSPFMTSDEWRKIERLRAMLEAETGVKISRRSFLNVIVAVLSQEIGPLATGSDPGGHKDLPISQMGLSVRAWRAVKEKGCETIRDVCRLTRRELLLTKNVGPTTVRGIELQLKSRGLELSGEDEDVSL